MALPLWRQSASARPTPVGRKEIANCKNGVSSSDEQLPVLNGILSTDRQSFVQFGPALTSRCACIICSSECRLLTSHLSCSYDRFRRATLQAILSNYPPPRVPFSATLKPVPHDSKPVRCFATNRSPT